LENKLKGFGIIFLGLQKTGKRIITSLLFRNENPEDRILVLNQISAFP
jgi:hypothetical protein